MSRKRSVLAVASAVALGFVTFLTVSGITNVDPDYHLLPGHQVTVDCPTVMSGAIDTNVASLQCAEATPTPTATASPTPSPSPTPGVSLTFPITAAFYYPWYPETWGSPPQTRYHPSLGFYDSSSASVIQSHVASMRAAGIQAGIASWWGQGTPTDGRVSALLANAGSLRWTLYYEPEGQGDPSSVQIGSDLAYLEAHYTNDPSWLRVNGKPVLFVYGSGVDGCGMADRWAAAPNRNHFYLVLKVFANYKACSSQPDSWHQYGPATAEDHQTGFSFSISPGFWKWNEASPRLARDLNRWKTNIAHMRASGEPWQLITTWNEWGEGTAIEPASEWGTSYLDAFSSASPSPSPSPTAFVTPTPSPTSLPTATPTVAATPSPTPTPTPSPAGSISHVVVVWLENHEASSVTTSSMPYLTGLAATYGSATNYTAVSHPSLPNYLAFWSGSTQGVTDDGTYNLSGSSLSSQFAAAGLSWRTYAQNYPSGGACSTGSSYSGGTDGWGVAGTYARKHNPAISFTSVSGNPAQCANIKPLATFDPSVNLAFVVPNLCNDAHDCSLGTADNFLRAFSPQVLNSADWAHTLYIVTFDEGTTGTGGGGKVYTMVARGGMTHTISATAHNHYGLTRTIETVFGLACLNNSCSGAPLSEFLP